MSAKLSRQYASLCSSESDRNHKTIDWRARVERELRRHGDKSKRGSPASCAFAGLVTPATACTCCRIESAARVAGKRGRKGMTATKGRQNAVNAGRFYTGSFILPIVAFINDKVTGKKSNLLFFVLNNL